ncbi:MAG: 3-dehydroquinate synthase [Bacteroidales bacterium]|jgi:3-dehydroquinate synthase|nr:3-dehydroquinate synthase [Bacteroidales bacterium]MDI9534224.1 3-dehydroquinate synthase [Bacteroidota bacterium]
MKRIRINGPAGESLILSGGTVDDVVTLLPKKGLFIITDRNVKKLYGKQFPHGEVIAIEPGEKSKRLKVVEEVCSRMLEAGADRSSFILGFGGGVVCDIAGMVASVYMRGVRHAFVSTTLLSQVDASIGGKTGVNLGEYKNTIGTFRQPEFVLCDHEMLKTLPEEEVRSGMGELFKYAVIRDRNLFFDISASAGQIIAGNMAVTGDLILRAVRIKAGVARDDPFEKGKRRILNFGHTFGHVIETHYGLPHGVAVANGMVIAAELSVWKGEMAHSELSLLQTTLAKAGLLTGHKLPANVVSMISRDKKSESDRVNFVLLRSIGRTVIRRISTFELQTFVNYYNEKESHSQ